MDQPLDLSLTNTKNLFTIEYLTSNNSNQKRKPPLIPLENKQFYLNEHVVPNISSPSLILKTNNNSLEIVNGGHGIKNPLFDCATEALQIKYGLKLCEIKYKSFLMF
jgi:hypothetical protein